MKVLTLTPNYAERAYDEALTEWINNPTAETEECLALAREELKRFNKESKDRHDRAVESINKRISTYSQGRTPHKEAISNTLVFWCLLFAGLIVGAVVIAHNV